MRAHRSKEILHPILHYAYIITLISVHKADNFVLSSWPSVTGNQEWAPGSSAEFGQSSSQGSPEFGKPLNATTRWHHLHSENSGDNPSISSCKNWIFYFLCIPSIIFLLVLIAGVSFYCKTKEKQRNTEVRDLKKYPKLLDEKSNSEEAQVEYLENNPRLLESSSKEEFEFLDTRFYRVDLTLDLNTANARLEVSNDGKSVRDTGNIHHVSMTEVRFEFHPFVLAEQGFAEGRHYWEVEVGQKNMWDVGVASESALRTGRITLSPQNGYWVIGCDRKYYWARTDPWTRLDMSNKPTRIGIHLNLKSHEISFYNPERKHKLYTFLHVASGKFYPFFSTGSVTREEFDNGKLIIPPWFEKEEIVEENEINN